MRTSMTIVTLVLSLFANPAAAADDVDGDGYDATADCNDYNPAINPGKGEQCNGLDDDCDGSTDEDWAPGDLCTYDDNDGDSYGASNEDCDDADSSIHPGATEVCGDNVDNDCNGVADGYGQTEITYDGVDNDCDTATVDDDLDGDGHVLAEDCDDTNSTIYSGATELYDTLDNDCDSSVDEGTVGYDDDGDGYSENDGDCNDADPNVRNNITEVCNGIDDDCDEVVDNGYDDSDGDGVADCLETDSDGDGYYTDDCDPEDATVYPGAEEIADGQDNDCDGISDEGTDKHDDDGDGYSELAGDCDDDDASINPGIYEGYPDGNSRDAVDNDCDGEIDERGYETDTADTGGDTGDGLILVSSGCNDDLKGGGSCSTSGLRNSIWGAIIGLLALLRRRNG